MVCLCLVLNEVLSKANDIDIDRIQPDTKFTSSSVVNPHISAFLSMLKSCSSNASEGFSCCAHYFHDKFCTSGLILPKLHVL